MEIYVTSQFLHELFISEEKYFKNRNRDKINICRKIINLLTSGIIINSNISMESIINSFDQSGNKRHNDIEDQIAILAVKNGTYRFSQMDFDEIPCYSGFFFMKSNLIASEKYGVVHIDAIDNIEQFYSNCTVNTIELKDDYSLIEAASPPCNSILLIDQYLFFGQNKIANFIKFIKAYNKGPLSIPFHLTIISSYEKKDNKRPLSQSSIELFTKELDKIPNLNYEILLDNKIGFDDRLIFTNYTKGSIGHPFDDRRTVFSQNFIGTSEKIPADHSDYVKALGSWKHFAKTIPDKIGIVKTRYLNVSFTNRLFTYC